MDLWATPEGQQRQWLLDRMRSLIQSRGPDEFLSTPLVAPNPRHFPDSWSGDEPSLTCLADRMLRYARLEGLHSQVFLFLNEVDPDIAETLPIPRQTHQGGAAAIYFGIRDGVCHFGVDVDSLGDPGQFIGSLGHEVGHAWRDHHGLFRPEDPEEEPLTDLTACYLGFGILTANAAYRFSTEGVQGGMMAHYSWKHSRSGYLTPGACCLLLAIHAALHYPDRIKDVKRWLQPNQAASFKDAIAVLDEDDLIEALGLPPRTAWPDLREVPVS